MVAALGSMPAATPEDGMRGRHEGSTRGSPGGRPSPDDGPGASAPLRRAAAGWQGRGYAVRYADPHLIQLIRAGRLTWQGLALIALAIPPLALAALLVARGLRQRYWHTVSITMTPDNRVVTHRQWAPYPPEDA
jgi:hypothetical protein